eukprot:gb/GEZN01005262.1/.p1 GENE.gb/GEZN01005262.1/~~gb/GEZN01005262.1/.p1  ORF type:complete len:429 (+),score=36.42 gb/GEZN01005262.1/:58-1344(+)
MSRGRMPLHQSYPPSRASFRNTSHGCAFRALAPSAIRGSGTCIATTRHWTRSLGSVPSPISQRLQQFQRDFQVKGQSYGLRIAVTTLAANQPTEDRYTLNSLGQNSLLFSVIDGHAGEDMAHAISELLPGYVLSAMAKDCADPFHQAFTSLDDDVGLLAQAVCDPVVAHALPEEELRLRVEAALSGACVLAASLVEGTGCQHLTVANAGDCRAVLGSWGGDNKEEVTRLTNDHNVDSEEEVRRLKLEHPRETLIRDDRLLGRFIPTRAMGDYCFKWKDASRRAFDESFPVFRLPADATTPPYLTTTPEIVKRTLRPDDKVLILATDGLWDTLSDEEAVEATRRYLETGPVSSGDNAATNLVRLALGPDHIIEVLLSLPPEEGRRYFDDVTVIVIVLEAADSVDGSDTLPEARYTSALEGFAHAFRHPL